MEIQVGEYVRTYDGFIGKLIDINKRSWNYLIVDCKRNVRTDRLRPLNYIYLKNENIVKHSFNIIDLIEVGDYVNGIEIDEFDDVDGNLYLGFPIYDDSLMDCISEFRPLETVEIKSIVTKEQFESKKYEV